MKSYEIAEALVGKTIKSADLGGKYGSIEFTDGSRLDLEAQDSGPDEWGYHASESIFYSFKDTAPPPPPAAAPAR